MAYLESLPGTCTGSELCNLSADSSYTADDATLKEIKDLIRSKNRGPIITNTESLDVAKRLKRAGMTFVGMYNGVEGVIYTFVKVQAKLRRKF